MLESSNERNGMDERLRVHLAQCVFIIGHCARFVESIGKPPLLALAKAAKREVKYLTQLMN